MALPVFFSRIADAAAPALGGVPNDELAGRLEAARPLLRCRDAAADDVALREGFLLAVNLAARLYPSIGLDAPDDLVVEAHELAQAINPHVDLDDVGNLVMAISPEAPEDGGVSVHASGWNVAVDGGGDDILTPAAPPAALAAATLGIGELFRAVFCDLLPRGRSAPVRRSLDLVGLGSWGDAPPRERIEIATAHLAGGGAIGQSTLLTLRAANTGGELVVVDHECLDASNLQRYVLALHDDVGKLKTDIAAAALADSALDIVKVSARWGDSERAGPGRDTVLVALDSAADRIAVQAGLHRRIYNAFTGAKELGWSRHERFGDGDACLACLYWPDAPRPHSYEIAANGLQQHPMRVRIYFANGTHAGKPMPPPPPLAVQPATPEELRHWQTTPIIDDIARALGIEHSELERWADKPLEDLYQDVVCGGAVVAVDEDGDTRNVLVPLAHQSALAGVMLATQLLVASDDELRARRSALNTGRIDVLTGALGPVGVPEFAVEACICRDETYGRAWSSRWTG